MALAFGTFTSFFKKAAISDSATIDSGLLEFREFEQLAGAANRMFTEPDDGCDA